MKCHLVHLFISIFKENTTVIYVSPIETVLQPAEKIEQPTVKSSGSSGKPGWLSNMIMNVVKSPSKGAGDQKAQKLGRNSAEPSSEDCPHDSNSNRRRKESRIALRVERKMSRSSSLDTVSTCLSQDSIKPPHNSMRYTNAY